ncbi:hypothetical protein [Pseudomonas sp. D3-10]|uniref:hypothetical protein n=1 Tax=Pseudomonas sp. D3-10 TaxID=2817392 RepID=UPI003DA84D46
MTHEQRVAAIQRVTIKASVIQAAGTLLVIFSALGIWHKVYPQPEQSVGFYVGGLVVFALTVTLVQQLFSQTMAARALSKDSEIMISAMYQELQDRGTIGPKKPLTKARSLMLMVAIFSFSTWFFIRVLS